MKKEKNKIRNYEFELNSYVVDSLLDVIRELIKTNKGE